MPSKFEPGGIVQHEFFVGSTPVIAMKTGGLQDTVQDFDESTEKGSGFTFDHHNAPGFGYAVTRALKLFKSEHLYAKLRKNSFLAAIEVNDVSKAYAGEFYRYFSNQHHKLLTFKSNLSTRSHYSFSSYPLIKWNKRMFNKNFIDKDTLTAEYNKIDMTFDINAYEPHLEIARVPSSIPSRESQIR